MSDFLDPGKMALRANVFEFEAALKHFYSATLSGEQRDYLEKRFDEMNDYHKERTGEKLFEANPVRVSKEKRNVCSR